MTTNTTATSTPIADITKKVQRATANTNACRAAVVTAVTEGLLSDRLNTQVLALAEAEGAENYWASMLHVAEYIINNDKGNVKAALTAATVKMLSTGADDSWSGRGNDAKRARFDGVRSAASNLEWLF